MALATPRVSETVLEYVQNDLPKQVALESSDWWVWLGAEDTRTFRFVNHHGTFTACREQKRGGQYWYAYRKIDGKLRKRYLGKTEQLSQARLSEIARSLCDDTVERRKDEAATENADQVISEKKSLAIFPPVMPDIDDILIVETRLAIPPIRSDLVVRSRLFEQLQHGLQRPLTIVSAPAGFGKSTLLASWKRLGAGAAIPLAWVSLDEEDNDPSHFWVYLLMALEKVQPGIGREILPLLQQSQVPPFRSWLPLLVNTLLTLEDELVLVLDDYHLVTNSQIHEALSFLLDYVPPRLHLILSGRTEPPLALGRLRARGQLVELRAAELRFTREEVAAFFQSLPDITLNVAELALLDAHTEGWVTGLQLAALALQGHKDPGRFIAEFAGSHRYVLDYLTEEVLQQQPVELQEFLLQTSILERLHAPLCNALTGRTDSGAILERLERAHLFVLPLDEQRDWYRYHQLFREFLDRQLQQTKPEQVYSLHVRAANWYEEQGLKVEAIQTWLKIQAYDRAIELIESLGGGLLMSGKVMMLQNWLNRLPEKMLERYPHVALYYCGCFVSLGLFEAAETSLKNAERWHRALQLDDDRRTPEKIQEFEADLLANRTVLAGFRGNVLETIDLAHKALREVPEDNYLIRGIIGIALGEAYGLKGDLGAALRAFEESRSLQFMQAHTVISLSIQAKLLVSRGNLRAAYKLLLQVQALEQDAPIQIFPTNSMFLTSLGELWYEWNDLVAAKNYLLKGVQLGGQWGNPAMQISTMLDLALVSLSQPARSLELIQEVKLLVAARPVPGLERWLEAMCAQLCLRLGQKEEAYRWSQTLPAISREQSGYWEESARIVQARILLVQQRFHESLALLEELFPAALERSHLSNSLKISLLRALNFSALGEPEPAFAALEQALEIGEPEGYIRSFVDEGPTLLPLLRQSLKRSKQRAYIQRLLAACEAAYEPESLLTLSRNVFPLSEREKHVIRLLADGKSNQQIADEFMVAVSTVKTHINNIYTKLGVHSRTQALVRARELLLVP